MSIGVFMPMIMGGKAIAKGKPWTLRSNPDPGTSSRAWRYIAYGNGVFVVFSHRPGVARSDGMISSDGIVWATLGAPDFNPDGLGFANGMFFLMGTGSIIGSAHIMRSANGLDWTTMRVRSGSKAVTHGNDTFVVVGASGLIATIRSATATLWTERTAPSSNTNNWETVAFGNGIFVALASTGTRRLMTSNDGIDWTLRASPDDTIEWQSVIFAKGKFVAVGFAGAIATSVDGINWILIPLLQDLPNNWTSISYGNGRFVVVSASGDKRVAISTNGMRWTLVDAAIQSNWIGVAYGDGIFAALTSTTSRKAQAIMTAP